MKRLGASARLCSSSGLAFNASPLSFTTLRSSNLSLPLFSLRFTANATSTTTETTSTTTTPKRKLTYPGLDDPLCWYDDEKENLGAVWPYFEEKEALRSNRSGVIAQRPPRADLFPRIPEPRGGETVATFLQKLKVYKDTHKTRIPSTYKDWDKLESKFKSWEHFFSCRREDMRKLGIKPCQVRKFLLNWMEKYRQGVDPGTCKYNLYYNRFNS